MPVLQNSVNTRLEILKTIYRLANKQAGKMIKLDAAQIDGAYYSEIIYELRFLKERGLVTFNNNFISRRFRIALTDAGVQLMEDAYHALSLKGTEKDELLAQTFAKLKI